MQILTTKGFAYFDYVPDLGNVLFPPAGVQFSRLRELSSKGAAMELILYGNISRMRVIRKSRASRFYTAEITVGRRPSRYVSFDVNWWKGKKPRPLFTGIWSPPRLIQGKVYKLLVTIWTSKERSSYGQGIQGICRACVYER